MVSQLITETFLINVEKKEIGCQFFHQYSKEIVDGKAHGHYETKEKDYELV